MNSGCSGGDEFRTMTVRRPTRRRMIWLRGQLLGVCANDANDEWSDPTAPDGLAKEAAYVSLIQALKPTATWTAKCSSENLVTLTTTKSLLRKTQTYPLGI